MNQKISTEEWTLLAGVDKHCFGCGFENSHGLQMRFESNGESLRSKLDLPERFRGWSNLIHGGVLSTILDETMSWTAIYFSKKFILTKGMQVEFLRPVRVGMQLFSFGHIKEYLGKREVIVTAEIKDEDDTVYAASEGTFALFDKKQFLRMKIIPEQDLELMSSLIPD